MPTVRPGTITFLYLGSTGTPPEVIAGDPDTAWADDDDATYATSYAVAGSFGKTAAAGASFGPLPASTTALTLRVRASHVTGNPYRAVVVRAGPAPLVVLSPPPAVNEDLVFAGSGIEEFSLPIPWLSAYSTQGLAAFFMPVRSPSDPFDVSTTIYELWLDVTAAATTAPPCRLYPRTDNLGNTPRNFPRPDSRQRSPRNTGTL